ncbi:glycosyltransferase family 61 protein [Paracoccus litorisediminis]|uniref:DUF563 domain-containing protein n=1 Tax=Paracoccus litorisediminis TaxID=2006130 RepID=A0A844HNM2_9RHOB|nr:glycosyltransferase family 61 protein [Paracoccus litorisediminis]MTH61456.1 DUF563 domain-containing protein [Paracoccus litorisediminis]
MKFFNFKKHAGIRFLHPPTDFLSPRPLGNVVAHNITTNERRRILLDTHINDYYWHRRMSCGYQLSTLLAEISNPGIEKKFLSSDGLVVLNGAAGDRARNALKRKANDPALIANYLKDNWIELQDPVSVPVSSGFRGECVIEAKNYFNFFHFMTESLHKVSSLDGIDASIDSVRFISKSKEVKPFVESWVREAGLSNDFPVSLTEIKPSESFGSSIVTPLSAKHLLYQLSGSHHDAIEATKPAGRTWDGYDARPHPVKILATNSFDDTLYSFRRRMIDLAMRHVERKWSSRIYAIRSSALLRSRKMEGEEDLIVELTKNGFEVVCFENMSPLEQVKCVSGARCVVMQHGAGMSNMIFARENAHFFEIGTYQTALARWGDFISLSHVSGCNYHHIFSNMDFADDFDPVFARDGLIAPKLDGVSIERIVHIIKSSLSDKRSGILLGLERHFNYYVSRRAYRHAFRLLDANASFFDNIGDYWMLRGRLNELSSHTESSIDNFYRAWDLSGSESAWVQFMRLSSESDPRRKLRNS